MRRESGLTNWWLALLIVGGSLVIFLLPLAFTATTPSDQSSPVPSPEPPAYDPEVQQLLETTYLGHAAGLPDPGEPALVLQKYLEQNAHGYHSLLAEQPEKLEAGLTEWQALVQQYPKSRHAFVGLAKHYYTKAQASGDIAYTQQAADAYIQAADLAMEHGRIRYTRELAKLLGELGDQKGLDEVFGRMLAQSQDSNPSHYYLALVDYADGLARFSDDRAWSYFERAIDSHPENNLEATNRYAKHLLDQGQPQKALEVLNTRLTSEQRVKYVCQPN